MLVAGWWALRGGRRDRGAAGALAKAATAAYLLAALGQSVWWAEYVVNRTRIDVESLRALAYGVCACAALHALAGAALARRGANLGPPRGRGWVAAALLGPLALAVVGLADASSLRDCIWRARIQAGTFHPVDAETQRFYDDERRGLGR